MTAGLCKLDLRYPDMALQTDLCLGFSAVILTEFAFLFCPNEDGDSALCMCGEERGLRVSIMSYFSDSQHDLSAKVSVMFLIHNELL